MRKIPTLFERIYDNHKIVGITDKIIPEMKWVLEGEGLATEKFDGSCTAIIDGVFYKRYDAKKGKKPPEGAIPCCEPDPITGHWPHWVVVTDTPENKWFINAYNHTISRNDGTYEAIGPHFQNNPYSLSDDLLIPHGKAVIDVDRSFEGIQCYLKTHKIEGIVFWKDGQPQCKIKRSDFGFAWPL